MSTNRNRITKKDQYNALTSLIDYAESNGATIDGDITFDGLREFIAHEIELLDAKTAAAQKRAAEKKQKGDALREEIYNTLSDTDFMTIDQIVEAINDPNVTRNMVTSRLSQLNSLGSVEKTMATIEGSGDVKTRKATAYRKLV